MKHAKKKNKQQKKGQLRDKKKVLTKEAILTAAETLFLEKPLKEVLIDDIAEAALVSRMTVYNYFKNKDSVYFQIGTRFFQNTNEMIETSIPIHLTGLEEMLILCKGIFTSSKGSPLTTSMLREFFLRIKLENVTIDQIYDYVLEQRKLQVDKIDYQGSEIHKFIEDATEPDLAQYFLQILRFEERYLQAIQKGKKDGSITNQLENHKILHYVFVLIEGIIEQTDLRDSTLELILLDWDTIVETSLELISYFLQSMKST